MNIFGKRLTDLRKERDLSRADIAGYLGMSRSGVQGYETEGKEPSYAMLCRLADYFGVSTDYLLGRSDVRRKSHAQHKPGVVPYNVQMSCLRYGVVRVSAINEDDAKKMAEQMYRANLVTWMDSVPTNMVANQDINADTDAEFEYMSGFVAEADFELDNLPLKQLRALWTSFCLHNNLDVDTAVYNNYLLELWEALLENGTGGFAQEDFPEFDRRMGEHLA